MSESIQVELPRHGFDDDLVASLAERGLRAEVVDDGDAVALNVRYEDGERERLANDVASAIERWLSDRMVPLVVERTDGTCVVRPPAE